MLRRLGIVNSGEHVSQIHTYHASCYICAYTIQTIHIIHIERELSTTEKPESIISRHIHGSHGIDPFRRKK